MLLVGFSIGSVKVTVKLEKDASSTTLYGIVDTDYAEVTRRQVARDFVVQW